MRGRARPSAATKAVCAEISSIEGDQLAAWRHPVEQGSISSLNAERYNASDAERARIATALVKHEARSSAQKQVRDFNVAAKTAAVEKQIKALDADGKVARSTPRSAPSISMARWPPSSVRSPRSTWPGRPPRSSARSSRRRRSARPPAGGAPQRGAQKLEAAIAALDNALIEADLKAALQNLRFEPLQLRDRASQRPLALAHAGPELPGLTRPPSSSA
jgi:hypothetical protein